VTTRIAPTAGLTTVTLALATNAPVGSFTRPKSVPEVIWPKKVAEMQSVLKRNAILTVSDCFMAESPLDRVRDMALFSGTRNDCLLDVLADGA
jgi:hypothetical protein